MLGLLLTIGTAVVTTRALYWVTLVGSIGVTLLGLLYAYILPETVDFGTNDCKKEAMKMKPLTLWVLITNLIGLVSAAFIIFYPNKGTTVSVIGSIIWIVNILDSIVLFFYAQANLF